MTLTIISGGQTGVDRGALDAALATGTPCGGWCPEGRMADDGVIPANYPVKELIGAGYRKRTRQNVLDSDATVIIYFDYIFPRGGTEQTLLECIKADKPYLLIDGQELSTARAAQKTRDFVRKHQIQQLNIAGPKAYVITDAQVGIDAHTYTQDMLTLLIQQHKTDE